MRNLLYLDYQFRRIFIFFIKKNEQKYTKAMKTLQEEKKYYTHIEILSKNWTRSSYLMYAAHICVKHQETIYVYIFYMWLVAL